MSSVLEQIRQLNQESVDIPSPWLDRLRHFDSGPTTPNRQPEIVFAEHSTAQLTAAGQSYSTPITYVSETNQILTADPQQQLETENHLPIPLATQAIDTTQTHELDADEILAEMQLLESIIDEELGSKLGDNVDSGEIDGPAASVEEQDSTNSTIESTIAPIQTEPSLSDGVPFDPDQILTPTIGSESNAAEDILTPLLDCEEEICEAVVSDLADRAKKEPSHQASPHSVFKTIEARIEAISKESTAIEGEIENVEHQQIELIEEFDPAPLAILDSFETDDVLPESLSAAVANLEMTKQFDYSKNKHRKRIDAIAEKIVKRFAPGTSATIMLVNLGTESNIDAASVNLASSIAIRTKAETLLVDANMSCRDISEGLGIESAPGVAEIINRNEEIAPLICRTDEANLHVLAAGKGQITNRKLDVDRVLELNQSIKPKFDYSIICGGRVDDLIVGALAPLVDGIYLMVDMGQSDRDFAKQAIDHLRRIRARVVGVIASQL